MKDYTKKYKQEMAFFIRPKTGYVTYNKMCLDCVHECKQSYRVDIVVCRHYEKTTKQGELYGGIRKHRSRPVQSRNGYER